MKRILLLAIASLSIAAPAAGNHGATQTARYAGPMDVISFFEVEAPCTGAPVEVSNVCFTVDESGLSSIHLEVVDDSGLPVTAYASVHSTAGVFGEQQFCGTNDIAVPFGARVERIVVHVGGAQEGGCGILTGLPSVGPIPVGELSFGTTGTVTVSYS